MSLAVINSHRAMAEDGGDEKEGRDGQGDAEPKPSPTVTHPPSPAEENAGAVAGEVSCKVQGWHSLRVNPFWISFDQVRWRRYFWEMHCHGSSYCGLGQGWMK